MRRQLEQLVGEEVCIFTVRTNEHTEDNGYYLGTLRRLSETAAELRQRDGNLVYLAFSHVVRFHALP